MTLEIQRPDSGTRGTVTVGASTPGTSGGITLARAPQPPPNLNPTSPPNSGGGVTNHGGELSLDDLGDLANPNKYRADLGAPPDPTHQGEIQPDDFGGMPDDDDDFGGNMMDDESPAFAPPPPEPEVLPTPPFKTLDEERAHLMFQLHKMRETGVPVRTFTYRCDIQELRAEFARLKAELDTKAAVRFSKTALMSVVSGMELLSRKQNVLEVNLDGWSEAVHQDVDKGNFDSVLEALYLKYRGKMSLPPELQLVFMLVSSAVAWHVMHSRLKSFQPPPQPQAAAPQPQPQTQAAPQPQAGERRVMRGPGFNLGGLAGAGLGGALPVPTRPLKRQAPPPAAQSDDDLGSLPDDLDSPAMSVLSDMSDLSEKNNDDDFAKDTALRDIRVVGAPPAKRAKRGQKKTVVLV